MALSKDTPLVQVVGNRNSIPAGSGLTFYEGAMVGESDAGDSGQEIGRAHV